MKKIFVTAAMVILGAAAPVLAAPPSAESLDALFELTRAAALMDSVSATIDQNLRQTQEQALAGQKLSEGQRKVIEAANQKSVQIVRDEISWAKLKPVYVSIYQESLTQEDIDGLIAFYRSPAGEAMMKKLPLVMQKTMTAVQASLAPMVEKLKAAQAQAIAEAKALK